jgi:hypothetical protein
MTETENEFTLWQPGCVTYSVVFILGSGVAFAIATFLLDLTPGWVALVVGGTMALPGAAMNQNIVEAIVMSLIIGLCVIVTPWRLPGLMVIKPWVVPGAIGFIVGMLVVGKLKAWAP